MAFVLRCPDCREKFPWNASKAFPKHCPLCGSNVASDRPDDDIVMPFIRHGKTDRTDKVYRDMERGSEIRAQVAADMAGVPVSEMSGLKITNLNDRKDAEIAAPALTGTAAALESVIQSHPGVVGHVNNGVQYSAAVQQGPHPNMGARMRTLTHQGHQDMVRQHAVGRDAKTGRPVAPSTDVTSEILTNEVMQPGYRRRG